MLRAQPDNCISETRPIQRPCHLHERRALVIFWKVMIVAIDIEPPTAEAVPLFMEKIEKFRRSMQAEEWRTFVQTNLSFRKWRFFLCADPYTRWGLLKPRGYPGDATLMDFAYGHASVSRHLDQTGELGRQIYQHTASAMQSRSARRRIDLLVSTLESLARQGPFDVTSFASGHARELEPLGGADRERVIRFTAIDTDPDSLSAAQVSAGSIPFVAFAKNVIKDDCTDIGTSDLVYSLGLFDYLRDEHAARVLQKMWKATRDFGTIIVANLSPEAANLAYCEGIMDWWMVTRTGQQMFALGESVACQGPARVSVATHGCFNYLTIVKQ